MYNAIKLSFPHLDGGGCGAWYIDSFFLFFFFGGGGAVGGGWEEEVGRGEGVHCGSKIISPPLKCASGWNL